MGPGTGRATAHVWSPKEFPAAVTYSTLNDAHGSAPAAAASISSATIWTGTMMYVLPSGAGSLNWFSALSSGHASVSVAPRLNFHIDASEYLASVPFGTGLSREPASAAGGEGASDCVLVG